MADESELPAKLKQVLLYRDIIARPRSYALLLTAAALGGAETLSLFGSAPTVVLRGGCWFAAMMPTSA